MRMRALGDTPRCTCMPLPSAHACSNAGPGHHPAPPNPQQPSTSATQHPPTDNHQCANLQVLWCGHPEQDLTCPTALCVPVCTHSLLSRSYAQPAHTQPTHSSSIVHAQAAHANCWHCWHATLGFAHRGGRTSTPHHQWGRPPLQLSSRNCCRPPGVAVTNILIAFHVGERGRTINTRDEGSVRCNTPAHDCNTQHHFQGAVTQRSRLRTHSTPLLGANNPAGSSVWQRPSHPKRGHTNTRSRSINIHMHTPPSVTQSSTQTNKQTSLPGCLGELNPSSKPQGRSPKPSSPPSHPCCAFRCRSACMWIKLACHATM